jgi:hypothetical protein
LQEGVEALRFVLERGDWRGVQRPARSGHSAGAGT